MKQLFNVPRVYFLTILLALVTQMSLAGTWANDKQVTYDFSAYSNTFTFSRNPVLCKTIGDYSLYTMEDRDGNTFYHALDAIFAAQNVDNWRIASDNTGKHLYQGGNGYRYLSISNLFTGSTITITYDNSSEGKSITFVDDSYVQSPPNDKIVASETSYTLAKDGPLDLQVARWVKIRSISIDYTGATNHPMFFSRNDQRIVYYKDNIPYYKGQLSTREFEEPTKSSSVTSFTIRTIETTNGYNPAVFRTTKTEAEPPVITETFYDVMMNNPGVSQIDLSNGTHTDSYRIEIWDNTATTSVTEIENGKKFMITGAGILNNRTITDVPGIEMRFSIAGLDDNPPKPAEPNTTVARSESGHFVAYTNDDYGWWDRYPHNIWTAPRGGTFYTFTATAKGRLKFGGVKMGDSGNVYLVKHSTHERKEVFAAGTSGYKDYTQFPTSEVDFKIDNTNGIEMEYGVTYDLQGETSPDDNQWAPYLIEWFSYELDNTLNINKTFAVSNLTGYQIGQNGSYTASDVTVEGESAIVGCYINNVWSVNSTEVKGSIASAKAEITNDHNLRFYDIIFTETGQDKMGGAIKVRIRTTETNYIDFTLTIPYGKHVWDFRSTEDQEGASRPGAWSYTDSGLWSMMSTNSSTANWQLVWKVRNGSQLIDPIVTVNRTINGDNAFCMDNTAGLIFSTNARSFGARDMRESNGDKSTWTAAQTSSANLLWVKGEATIYFPGVTAGQYIKIYTYRHSDDKGETFKATNLLDLDGKPYNANDKFIMHGMWEERYPAYKGDNIKGCAIFKVPSDLSGLIDEVPQLTLCDDGWMKIYRIEIMDEFEPDIILTDDNPGGDFCPVDYDGEFGSVVVRKENGRVNPVFKSYIANVGQTQCQHANTCDYQIIADDGVVEVSKEVWTSNGGVDYNKLNLKYQKSGLVKIVQRERGHLLGSTNSWTETIRDEKGNLTYENISATNPESLPSGYVIDKNEYFINVGELTVQSYPYTWDFTTYNMYQGTSKTKTNLANSKDTSIGLTYWTGTAEGNTFEQMATDEKQFGVLTDHVQQLAINKHALFPQGAQLMSSNGTAVAETEGLGVSRPKLMKEYNYYATVNSVFDKRTRSFEGYNLEDKAIKINENNLTGVGEIVIPNVDNGMYIFVRSSKAPSYVTGATVPSNVPFSIKPSSNIHLYQQTGDKRDVVFTFDDDTTIEFVGVTDMVKQLDKFGYATESRDRAIDHTYEGVLTDNNVSAYIITTADDYGTTYNYKGYPMVKKTEVSTTNGAGKDNIVPANVGVILCKDNYHGDPFKLPLLTPAVNNMPAYNEVEANQEFWSKNWMIPNVRSKQHYNEGTSKAAAAETPITSLPYNDEGVIKTPEHYYNTEKDFIFGSIHSDPVRYVDLSGYKELRIYQPKEKNTVRCFFYNDGSGDGSATITPTSNSSDSSFPYLEQVNVDNSNLYYKLDLHNVFQKFGQVKLIGIKGPAPGINTVVTDVKAISYVQLDPTWNSKFVMAPSYYTYYQRTGTSSKLTQADTEAFYRMRLATGADAAAYNTLGDNKALLLIPNDNLPTALWNAGSSSGAREGMIYMDLQDIEANEATGVDAPMTDFTDEDSEQKVYHTLSGIRINGKPTTKGIYICNGKKVSVQ